MSGRIILDSLAEERAQIDPYANVVFHGTGDIFDDDQFIFYGLPAGEKLIDLWVP